MTIIGGWKMYNRVINLHGHTDGSNYNFRDSIISVEQMCVC